MFPVHLQVSVVCVKISVCVSHIQLCFETVPDYFNGPIFQKHGAHYISLYRAEVWQPLVLWVLNTPCIFRTDISVVIVT